MAVKKDQSTPRPIFDVWVCQGRVCASAHADALFSQAIEVAAEQGDRCRVLRGGCYGLCELAPNLVVRRYPNPERRPDASSDRLSLTHAENETVYSLLDPRGDDVHRLLSAHLLNDRAETALTRQAKERDLQDDDSVAGRIRTLRRQRGR